MVSQSRERHAEYMREYRKTEKHKAYTQTMDHKWRQFGHNLKRRYGVTPEWVEQKYQEQEEKCAICLSPIYYNVGNTRGDKMFSIHVDHDHKTGEPRGLLCQNCNIALGKLMDNPEAIIRAYRYVMGQ